MLQRDNLWSSITETEIHGNNEFNATRYGNDNSGGFLQNVIIEANHEKSTDELVRADDNDLSFKKFLDNSPVMLKDRESVMTSQGKRTMQSK